MSNKYFLDIKIMEGPHDKRTFGIPSKTLPTLDMISIGIAGHDSREYYAVSKEFNMSEAWGRVDKINTGITYNSYGEQGYVETRVIRDTILKKIFYEFLEKEIIEYNFSKGPKAEAPSSEFTFKRFEVLLKKYGKTNKEISEEVLKFCRPKSDQARECEIEVIEPIDFPEFYSYFAAPIWVTFCWLFGSTRKVPAGFPLYCRDIKQMLDDKAEKLITRVCYESGNHTIWSLSRAMQDILGHPDYPKHDSALFGIALEDAKYFKKLYTFIRTT